MLRTYECVCHTYECVMSHTWMRHGTHMNASRHTYACVTAHIWMRRVTHMNASRHTYECVMPHMWMSHATHMNESCHTFKWVMSHIWMRHATHVNSGVIHTCDMTHSWHGSFICVWHDRVRSMRMGFYVQRFLGGGKPLYIQRFSENVPRFRRAGLPSTSVETYQKIWGPSFSSFHWSPRNLQVFKFSLESP